MVFPSPSREPDWQENGDGNGHRVRSSLRTHDLERVDHPQRHAMNHAPLSLPRELLVRASIEDEIRCLRDHTAGTLSGSLHEPIPLLIEGPDGHSMPHGSIPRYEFIDFLESKLVTIWGYMDLHRHDPAYHHFNARFEDNGHHWQVTYSLDATRNLVKSYFLRDDRSKFKSESPVFHVIFKQDSARKGNQIFFIPYDQMTITSLLADSEPSTSRRAHLEKSTPNFPQRMIRSLSDAVRTSLKSFLQPQSKERRYVGDPRVSIRRVH